VDPAPTIGAEPASDPPRLHPDVNVRPLFRAALAALVVACPVRPVVAQEVGAGFAVADSDHESFPSPSGPALHVLFDVSPDWFVDLTLQRLSADVSGDGIVCANYTPRVSCAPELVHQSTTMSGFRAGIARNLLGAERWRVGAGVGLSFNQLDARSMGVSGREGDLLAPNGGQLGALGFLRGALAPFDGLGLRLTGKLTTHWVDFSACSGETPPRYDPFCTAGTFHEVQLGLVYVFAQP
jgi:hypothetical protein